MRHAAKSAGVGTKRLQRYMEKHEGFKREVAAARARSDLREHHGPRIAGVVTRTAQAEVLLTQPGAPEGDFDARDPDQFLRLLSAHANDGDSRGCSKALEIFDRWHNAEHYLAVQARAKAAAAELERGDVRPMQILVPPSAKKPIVETEFVELEPI